MISETLKDTACALNLALVEKGLVFQTWGNASVIDREAGLVAIKPSGVDYATMKAEDMAVVDLSGKQVEGALKPSVDLATHLELYKAWPEVGAVIHTHSHYATCWAQARRPIPCFGTTHADYCYGEIPLAEALMEAEVATDYEANIGRVILQRFEGLDPMQYPGVLAAGHGPFTWGKTPEKALENAEVLEEVARMALTTLTINPKAQPIERYLLDKHFLRKHGGSAYYGQKG